MSIRLQLQRAVPARTSRGCVTHRLSLTEWLSMRELLRIFNLPPLLLKEQQALHLPRGRDPQLVVPDTPRINLGPLSRLQKTPNQPWVTIHRPRESQNLPRPNLV